MAPLRLELLRQHLYSSTLCLVIFKSCEFVELMAAGRLQTPKQLKRFLSLCLCVQ